MQAAPRARETDDRHVTALVVLLLPLAVSYLFCVKPMTKGPLWQGQLGAGTGKACQDQTATEEAAGLKAEILVLRTQSARPDHQIAAARQQPNTAREIACPIAS